MNTDSFKIRHIGPQESDHNDMLKTIGVDSLEQLIYQTIPDNIKLQNGLQLEGALSEQDYLSHIHDLALKNKIFKSYIGLGYHPSILPAVIQRNILENPGWYTAYTPYQAEISQGRLEALLNFQTMVCDLTGMEIANASLLDESTAAARFNVRPGVGKNLVNDCADSPLWPLNRKAGSRNENGVTKLISDRGERPAARKRRDHSCFPEGCVASGSLIRFSDIPKHDQPAAANYAPSPNREGSKFLGERGAKFVKYAWH